MPLASIFILMLCIASRHFGFQSSALPAELPPPQNRRSFQGTSPTVSSVVNLLGLPQEAIGLFSLSESHTGFLRGAFFALFPIAEGSTAFCNSLSFRGIISRSSWMDLSLRPSICGFRHCGRPSKGICAYLHGGASPSSCFPRRQPLGLPQRGYNVIITQVSPRGCLRHALESYALSTINTKIF